MWFSLCCPYRSSLYLPSFDFFVRPRYPAPSRTASLTGNFNLLAMCIESGGCRTEPHGGGRLFCLPRSWHAPHTLPFTPLTPDTNHLPHLIRRPRPCIAERTVSAGPQIPSLPPLESLTTSTLHDGDEDSNTFAASPILPGRTPHQSKSKVR